MIIIASSTSCGRLLFSNIIYFFTCMVFYASATRLVVARVV